MALVEFNETLGTSMMVSVVNNGISAINMENFTNIMSDKALDDPDRFEKIKAALEEQGIMKNLADGFNSLFAKNGLIEKAGNLFSEVQPSLRPLAFWISQQVQKKIDLTCVNCDVPLVPLENLEPTIKEGVFEVAKYEVPNHCEYKKFTLVAEVCCTDTKAGKELNACITIPELSSFINSKV